jgi:hypothetical protein
MTFIRFPVASLRLTLQAATATESNDTPVSPAETSQSRFATAVSFACGMIFAGTGGPFNS